MTYNEASDLAWHWELQDGKYALFWDRADSSLRRLYSQKVRQNAHPSRADEPLPLMAGKTRLDISLFGPLSAVIGLVVVLAFWLSYKLLLLAAQRIFLMDYGEDDIPNNMPGSHTPLWAFVKFAGHSVQELLQTTSHAEVIDLLQSAAPSELQRLPYSTWQRTGPLVIVDHLASRLHEEAWRGAILSMLEALAFRYTGPVVIRSAIDPLYSLVERASEGGTINAPPKRTAESETPSQDTGGAKESPVTEEFERWARVFAEFSSHRVKLLKLSDTLQREEEVLEARFWTIWSQCTRSEKLALRQLAEEGFLNPGRAEVMRSEVIRSLGHRLLIYRSPALRMSPSFRQFVLRAESSQTIAQLEGDTEASWLSRLQMPLLAGLIAVMVFLLSTQQELYTKVVALGGTFTAVLPHLIQLFGTSRGRRGESL